MFGDHTNGVGGVQHHGGGRVRRSDLARGLERDLERRISRELRASRSHNVPAHLAEQAASERENQNRFQSIIAEGTALTKFPTGNHLI